MPEEIDVISAGLSECDEKKREGIITSAIRQDPGPWMIKSIFLAFGCSLFGFDKINCAIVLEAIDVARNHKDEKPVIDGAHQLMDDVNRYRDLHGDTKNLALISNYLDVFLRV